MEYREAILHIEGCNKEYIITTDGQIIDINTRTPRKFNEHHKGYLKCGFYINGKYKQRFVHRLVLMTFNPVEGMDKLQVDHKDGNKHNNCIDNLEWVTNIENAHRAIKNGLWDNCTPIGDDSHNHKLNSDDVAHIKYLLQKKYSYSKLASMFNISKPTIYQIANEITWKDVQPKEISVESSTTR